MLRFLVLVGYFELGMYLQLSGKLDQYINIHYSYLAYISMVLSLILAIVQLIIWMKKLEMPSHLTTKSAKWASIILLVFPIAVGLLVPTVTLDSITVSAKGYHFPLASGSSPTGESSDGTRIQYLKPDTSLYFTKASYNNEMKKALDKYKGSNPLKITSDNYMEVMELIYLFPDEFIGREINYLGFVYNDPKTENYQFLFRFGIIHCIADSGVYGLLTKGENISLEDNNWVNVKGKLSLEYNQNLDQTLPVLEIESIQNVQEPDNPYVYRVF
ncbi:TIGR03943 family putative permease subunit [Streptococcus sp. CSL10205-OR2]|uniref:TIGR03943 family putative permease subunit n=1 Tax=Streptococcus sp. CSL10205-OR2 TaxID=2980558 RepID=UPI0021DA4A36|nr:TIGR03943 family protein [Streptococcus sp. CSL10205-OR2]MCU9532932.1 TIGR03943 family protein [Streptococcus sp. CSL10205-OR2]